MSSSRRNISVPALVAALLLLCAGALWVLSSGERPQPDAEAARDAEKPVRAPQLIGGDAIPPEPAPGPTVDEPEAETPDTHADVKWRIDFDVEGHRHWNNAIFVPATPGRPAVRVGNPIDGPAHGSIDVVGAGRLLVRCRLYLTWISETLQPPPSGVMALTATMEEGLAVSGTVVAPDGVTPVSEGQVRIRKAQGVPDIPHSEPWSAWVPLDANGRFRLTGLRPGAVTLHADPRDKTLGDRTTAEVQAGDANIHIRLKPIGTVELKIFDVETGKAPKTSSVHIEYTGSSGHPFSSMMSRRPDQEGPPIKMTLRRVVVGKPATIRMRVNGYRYLELSVEFPAEGGFARIDAPLERARGGEATLVAELRFEGGAVPDDVMVMRFTQGAGMGSARKIENDAVSVPLTPGTTKVVFGSGDWIPVTIDVEETWTTPGARVEELVTLTLGGSVRFKERPPSTVAELRRGDETMERRIGRRDRISTLNGIPQGTWKYRIVGKHAIWTGEVTIKAGETTQVTSPHVEHKAPKAEK